MNHTVYRISDVSAFAIATHLTDTIEHLNLGCCEEVTDAGAVALAQVSHREEMWSVYRLFYLSVHNLSMWIFAIAGKFPSMESCSLLIVCVGTLFNRSIILYERSHFALRVAGITWFWRERNKRNSWPACWNDTSRTVAVVHIPLRLCSSLSVWL